MASKGVTDRQRIAKAIVAAAEIHAQQVGERLQEVLAPALQEGQSLPDLVGFQRVLAQYLDMRVLEIVEADEGHVHELQLDAGPRRRRDEAAAALRGTLVGIREALVGAFGRDSIPELAGLEGDTAIEPVRLLRQANRVLKRLSEPVPELGTPRFDGLQVDFETLAGELQPALDELTLALREVDRELKKADATLRAKDTALDSFDAAVGGIGRILTGFDQLAGFSEYAEKVRLTRPFRRRSNSGGEEPPPGPGPEGVPEGLPDGGLPPTFTVREEVSPGK